MEIKELSTKVVNAVYEVHRHLPEGFLEIVYRNALVHELRSSGLKCTVEMPIQVLYKGHVVGDYRCDILVEDCLILELKAKGTLNPRDEVQLVNYLVATGIDYGLLINFGSEKPQIKRKRRIFTRS